MVALLYENIAQARKVRLLLAASLLFGAVCLGWATAGDFGEETGNSLRVGTGLFGIVLAIATSLYARQYVIRIEAHEGRVTIRMLGLLAPAELNLARSEIRDAAFREGEAEGGPEVYTPWIALRIESRRLPLLIDLKAEKADRRALLALAPRS